MRYLLPIIILLLIIPIAYSADCQGTLKFSIYPTFAPPGCYVSPSVYGLENCDGTFARFTQDSKEVSNCMISSGGCEGASFILSQLSGANTFYAYVDSNNNGQYDYPEYQTSLIYMTGYANLPEFSFIGIFQIMLVASAVLILLKKKHN